MYSSPIGISTIAVGRRGLDLVGQNIANAATPGYHRQGLNLVSQTSGDGRTGVGVDVASVTRYTAAPVRAAILRGNGDAGYSAARLDAQQQLETALGTSPNTIADGIESFFTAVGELTARPESTAARRSVVSAAADVAGRFNAVAGDADQLRQSVGRQVGQVVTEVNDFATRIAGLNARISTIESGGGQANDLRDQRDQLINDLSQRMDVRTVPQEFGVVNVLASGAAVVVGEFPNTFTAATDAAGQIVVTQAGSTQPLSFESGSLGGLLQTHNQDIPAFRSKLDGLARDLAARVNAVHATGIGATGPMTGAAAGVSVADVNAPLATQALAATPTAGTLTLSVTNGAGVRTNVPVAFDPATQSLSDLASAITGATGGAVTAAIDPQTNVLSLTAQSGYSFDFAGRAPTSPPGDPAVANPDAGGLLPALGIGGLFAGSDAASLAVRPDVRANPQLLAASRSGAAGDAGNLERLAAVRDAAGPGGTTAAEGYADLAAAVGADVRQLDDRATAQAAVLQNLNAQELSVTGVDINEELVRLLDYQRMVESGTKYLSAVNTALDSIMQMVN